MHHVLDDIPRVYIYIYIYMVSCVPRSFWCPPVFDSRLLRDFGWVIYVHTEVEHGLCQTMGLFEYGSFQPSKCAIWILICLSLRSLGHRLVEMVIPEVSLASLNVKSLVDRRGRRLAQLVTWANL